MTKNHSWEEHPKDTRREPRDLQKEEQLAAEMVSVVIPCYNQAHFLSEAIESVLAQSYPHFEIVVVDDGSTDNTSEVAARYPRVRCIRQDNQGLSAARNSGLSWSKGSYLVFLDADDRLLPDALEVSLECLKAHPESAFVSGHHRLVAADGSYLWESDPPRIEEDHYAALLRVNYIGMHATVMYRRSVFESVGGFDPSVKFCEDHDLYFRIARDFPIYRHGKVVAEYRRHDETITRDYASMLKGILRVFRSQRPYVKRVRRYQEAHKTGVRFYRDCYGIPLAWQVLDHMREREWKEAIRDLLVLLRYHPRIFARLFTRGWQKLGLPMSLRQRLLKRFRR